MNSVESRIQHFLRIVNSHNISEIGGLLAKDCVWKCMHGKEHAGLSPASEMWASRWKVFPDFQVQLVKMADIVSIQYVHANFMGSMGANKSIELSFMTPVILEMEWTDAGLKSCKEFGDPSKMLELEGIQKPRTTAEMTGVSGFGGVFFKTKDPKSLATWYDECLGTHFGSNTRNTFKWRDRDNQEKIGRTEFRLFKADSDYFAPSESGFMLNFRVHNLEEMLRNLAEKNITIVGNTEVFEYGKFAWILDPDGNKIELWEPVDTMLEAYDAG